MSFLAPIALLWLLSVPVLLWLWRLAASRHQVQVPSLIPFEHLLKRAPRRRTHLVVNWLFWLQIGALLGLVLALTRPVLMQRRAKTTLVILDTSASMGARMRGTSPFDLATQTLAARIARKSPTDQFFVVTTSPVSPLTPQPSSDAVALINALRSLRVNHLGGSLATAVRIGRALLAEAPDETVVLTDEPQPAARSADRVDPSTRAPGMPGGLHWVSVGQPIPNIAIVGLDAEGPLCAPSDARVIITIQNFSDESATVTVSGSRQGERFTEATERFAPRARRAMSVSVPEGMTGLAEIELHASPDGLEVDNRAWVDLHRSAPRPIIVRSSSAPFRNTLAAWLGACQALSWTLEPPAPGQPSAHTESAAVIIADGPEDLSSATAAMVFNPPIGPQGRIVQSAPAILSHWVTASDHPISAYFPPVDAVSAALNLSAHAGASGVPVVSGLVNGRKVPIIVADERDDRRIVSVWFDPSSSEPSTPVLLAFFNSLRWLMGTTAAQSTGEPLALPFFRPGSVIVRRPDGSTERVESDGALVRYDSTTLAGPYRFSQGSTNVTVAVNFFDPLESDMTQRVSTWGGVAPIQDPTGVSHPPPAGRLADGRRAPHSLSHLVILFVLVLVLAEWWWYSVSHQQRSVGFEALSRGGRPVPPQPVRGA